MRVVMSQAIERILEEARKLAPEERSRLIELLRDPTQVRERSRAEAVDRVFGKYSHTRNSSESFCARKAEEIELENRRQR